VRALQIDRFAYCARAFFVVPGRARQAILRALAVKRTLAAHHLICGVLTTPIA
jgi:hypothetical protein